MRFMMALPCRNSASLGEVVEMTLRGSAERNSARAGEAAIAQGKDEWMPCATGGVPAPWPAPGQWVLYLLECDSGAWYAGITNRMQARYRAHAEGKGAKYTRANPPVGVVGCAQFADRSSASKAEASIKRLPRSRKLAALQGFASAESMSGEQGEAAPVAPMLQVRQR